MMKKTLALFLSIILLLTSVISTAGAESAQAVTEAVSEVIDNITTDATVEGETEATSVATEATTQTATEAETTAPTEAPTEPAVTELSGTLGDHTVTVTGNLPAGATLELSAVDMDSAQQIATDMYKKEAVFACDIKIFDADGNEWQPDESVFVTVSDLTVGENQKLGFLHIADGEEVEDLSYANANADGDPTFSTTGFSTFVGYTVDFSYDTATHSILGESSILLSELFEALSIDKDAKTAVSVEFTNYDLIKVEQQSDNDWLLTSLKAFSSTETLTVTLPGEVLVITVTDELVHDWPQTGVTATIESKNNINGSREITDADGNVTELQIYQDTNIILHGGIAIFYVPLRVMDGCTLRFTGSGTLKSNILLHNRGMIIVEEGSSLEITADSKDTPININGEIVRNGSGDDGSLGVFFDGVTYWQTKALITLEDSADATLSGGHLKLLNCNFDNCNNASYFNINGSQGTPPVASCILLNGTRDYVHIDSTTFSNIGKAEHGYFSSAIRVAANFVCTDDADPSTTAEGLKIRNSSFTNCYADAGAAIYYTANSTDNTVELSACNFYNCHAVNHGGGAIFFAGSTKYSANEDYGLKIRGCHFEECYADDTGSNDFDGGAIMFGAGNTLASNADGDSLVYKFRALIEHISAGETIAGVTYAGGKLAEIGRCHAKGTGGGLATRESLNNGTEMYLDIKSAKFTHCTAGVGGGISWREKGKLNFIGDPASNEDFKGAHVSNCTADNSFWGAGTVGNGGGIYIDGGATVETSGNVNQCTVTNGNGGGIAVFGGSTLTVSGGLFYSDKAINGNGGAIYLDSASVNTLNMSGGKIADADYDYSESYDFRNIANYGGGIYANNANVNITGGEITNCIAYEEGAALNAYNCKLYMSGMEIFGNKAFNRSEDADGNGTLETLHQHGGAVLLNACTPLFGNTNLTIENCEIYNNSAGTDTEKGQYQDSYGGGICFIHDGNVDLINTKIYNNNASFGGGMTIFPSGSNANVNLKSGSAIYGNVAKTFGGGVFIEGNSSYNAALTISDGTIGSSTAGNSATVYGGGVAVWDYATLNMNGGTIDHNTAGRATADELPNVYDGGAGVYVSNTGGTMTMSGGTISNNTVARYGGHSRGGGIYNRGALTITGGTFDNNEAINGGGIGNFGTASISNAIFKNNSADNGGGVFSYGTISSLTVDNCDIFNNTCHDEAIAAPDDFSRGGGIFAESTPNVKVNGCKIYSNTAHEGGGVYILDSTYNEETKASITHAYVQNCYIYDNTANGVGKTTEDLHLAGVSSAYTLSEGRGGGVYLSGCNTADLSGSKIGVKEDGTAAGNKADTNGGGVYVAKGNFTLTSGEISNNKAGENGLGSGGGIYFGEDVRIINEVQYIENGETKTAYSVIGSQYYHGDTDYNSFAVTISNNVASGQGGGVWSGLTTTSQTYWDGIKFSNCKIDGNTAGVYGGGIYCEFSPSLTINSHSIVSNNTAGDRGGGVYIAGRSITGVDSEREGNLNTDYARFYKNTAQTGGGIFARNAKLSFWAGTEIIENKATNGAGGGLRCYTGDYGDYKPCNPQLYVYNLKVSGNTATTNGGGIYLDTNTEVWGTYVEATQQWCVGATSFENPEKFGVEISNNIAGNNGGGLYSESTSALRCGNTKITGNIANNGHGGGVYIKDSADFMLRYNSEVSGNLAKMNGASRGGGVYINNVKSSHYNAMNVYNNEASYGGGFFFENSNGNFWGGTDIHDNKSAIGGAGVYVYASSNVRLETTDAFIRNNTATGTGTSVSPYNTDSGFSGFGGGVCVIGLNGSTASFVQNAGYVYNNIANYAADDVGGNIYSSIYVEPINATQFEADTGVKASSWYTDYTDKDISTTQTSRISGTNASRYRDRILIYAVNGGSYNTGIYKALTVGTPGTLKVTIKYYGRNYDAASGSYADISQTASTFSKTYTLNNSTLANQIKANITNAVVNIDQNSDVQYALNNVLDEYICYTSQNDAETKTGSEIHTNWYDQAQTYDTEQWVTYYKMGEVVPDISNVGIIDEVVVWLRNGLREYDYSFTLVTDKAGQIGDNGVAYGNTVSGEACYNQRLGFELGSGGNVDENTAHLAGHGKKAWLDVDADTLETVVQNGVTYTFSHWSTKADGSDVFSTERLYRNRITSDLELYAVYTKTPNATKNPGLVAIKGLIETYNVDSTAKTAINTIMNPYNCAKSDPNITQVGVVYAIGDGTAFTDAGARTQILDKLENNIGENGTSETKPNVNGSFKLTGVGASKANCRAYYSFAGTENCLLTNRNRLQFTEVFTTSTLASKQIYAYVAMYYKGVGWILSDNYIDYQFDANGAAK